MPAKGAGECAACAPRFIASFIGSATQHLLVQCEVSCAGAEGGGDRGEKGCVGNGGVRLCPPADTEFPSSLPIP
eukprot:scaffold1443_cov116-Isochrysis_galbana.AAC.6